MSEAKRVKTTKTIGTHNGTFHCDEALAVYLLRQTSTFKGSDVLRTRDPAKLETCDIVVDVGAVYDANILRFDHHQREFNETFGPDWKTKLSSAGLVYKHFGKEIVASALNLPVENPNVELVYLKMYKSFIEAIDAIDNGISQYDTTEPQRYSSSTDLSARVGFLNPAWNEKVDSAGVDARFEQASSLTGSEFTARLQHYASAWLPARDIVRTAFDKRQSAHASGRIVLFESYAPWRDHLYDVEKDAQLDTDSLILFVVYPDETGGSWRVQAVTKEGEAFTNRKSLPEPWRGVRDDKLSEVTGIPGGVFVHASGFIGGNKTKEGALQMATKALEWQ
ncbi:metal-dependent protein hydrolase [Exidia glandulosa HHB12029]|uniref:Metal-dependent protein hydrolase n=1 Tax=Exidia glandulosa HHB12029 TaxID=1314781 RepID=A0A166AJS8_EXIGL|nr:metal-dependent protein hydrolase [Exidia glandulosa HHB12029]